MKNLKYYTLIALIGITQIAVAQTKKEVDSFTKVIISPHIQATFIKGDTESVIIEESSEPEDKINIDVKQNTLRVYLDDAKETTKSKTVVKNGRKIKEPIYKGKVLTLTITYKKLKELSIRGKQTTICKNKIDTEAFKLTIYGDSQVIFDTVNFQEFNTTIYGVSNLEIKNGTIENQKITSYGNSIIDLLAVSNKTTKLTNFGNTKFKIQSSQSIKLTAFGEAELHYKGNATIEQGLNIGKTEISQID